MSTAISAAGRKAERGLFREGAMLWEQREFAGLLDGALNMKHDCVQNTDVPHICPHTFSAETLRGIMAAAAVADRRRRRRAVRRVLIAAALIALLALLTALAAAALRDAGFDLYPYREYTELFGNISGQAEIDDYYFPSYVPEGFEWHLKSDSGQLFTNEWHGAHGERLLLRQQLANSVFSRPFFEDMPSARVFESEGTEYTEYTYSGLYCLSWVRGGCVYLLRGDISAEDALRTALSLEIYEAMHDYVVLHVEEGSDVLPAHDLIYSLYEPQYVLDGFEVSKTEVFSLFYIVHYTSPGGDEYSFHQTLNQSGGMFDTEHHSMRSVERNGITYTLFEPDAEPYGLMLVWAEHGYRFDVMAHGSCDAEEALRIAESLAYVSENNLDG